MQSNWLPRAFQNTYLHLQMWKNGTNFVAQYIEIFLLAQFDNMSYYRGLQVGASVVHIEVYIYFISVFPTGIGVLSS